MNAGKLNKRIALLKFLEIEDNAGGYVDNWPNEGWQEVVKIWADIDNPSGREIERAQQYQAEITHRITIRYRTDIDRSMTINYKGRRFDVEYIINPFEKKQWLQLMCVERV